MRAEGAGGQTWSLCEFNQSAEAAGWSERLPVQGCSSVFGDSSASTTEPARSQHFMRSQEALGLGLSGMYSREGVLLHRTASQGQLHVARARATLRFQRTLHLCACGALALALWMACMMDGAERQEAPHAGSQPS